VNPYSGVSAEIRSALRQQGTNRDLLALTKRMQHTSELLDLSAQGVAASLREGRYGEAQSRCEAAEQALDELATVMRTLTAKIRNARRVRTVAA
jgi:hypothetical protein